MKEHSLNRLIENKIHNKNRKLLNLFELRNQQINTNVLQLNRSNEQTYSQIQRSRLRHESPLKSIIEHRTCNNKSSRHKYDNYKIAQQVQITIIAMGESDLEKQNYRLIEANIRYQRKYELLIRELDCRIKRWKQLIELYNHKNLKQQLDQVGSMLQQHNTSNQCLTFQIPSPSKRVEPTVTHQISKLKQSVKQSSRLSQYSKQRNQNLSIGQRNSSHQIVQANKKQLEINKGENHNRYDSELMSLLLVQSSAIQQFL